MKTLRLFISSPGDVGREREATRRVIDRLQSEFAEHITLDPYFWEWEPVDFGHDYQSQIPSTADFDIVICLLWSKLGSRLHDQYKLPPDYQDTASSGTQYELMQALHGKQQHPEKLPDLLVWVNKAPPPPASSPPLSRQDEDELIRQRRALQDFLATLTRDTRTGIFTAAVNRYEVPSEDLGSYTYLDEFEDLMDKKLRKLIEKHIGQRTVKPRPQWQGSPFRDLDVFEFQHAPIFFGRSRAVGEVVRLLQNTLTKAERCHFALILGASGSGKSSLARAGVLPLLTRPGVIEGIGLWRCAIVRPSDDSADLFQALASALLSEGRNIEGRKIESNSPSSNLPTPKSSYLQPALPELADPESPNPQQSLAAELRAHPQTVAIRVKDQLSAVAKAHQTQQRHALEAQISSLTKEGRQADAALKQQALQNLQEPKARLVLLLDQMEELFTLNYAPEQLRAFLETIAVLARSGRVFVIGTLRSDFYPRYQEQPTLVALARDGARFDLLPPTPDEISQIIRRPASLAALQFEPHPTTAEHTLADTLRDEALADTEALPLLEHVLNRLYQAQLPRADGRLTFADYEDICGVDVNPKTGGKTSRGVGGALGKHAEDIFTGQNRPPTDPPPPWTEDTFRAVFRCLVTFGKGEGDTDVPNRRTFTYQDLIQSDPAAQALVDTFIHERLLIADTDAQSRPIVRLSHEALLTRWPRLANWLQTAPVRDLMSQRRRLESSLRQWQEQNRTPDCYLQPGYELEEGKQLLEKHEAALKEEEREFIRDSVTYHAECEHKATRRRRLVVAVLLGLTIIALVGGWYGQWQALRAKLSALEANKQRTATQIALAESNHQLERSQVEEGRAWLERGRAALNKGDHLSALMLAGRAVGYKGYGRLAQESPTFSDAFPLLLAKTMEDPVAERERVNEAKATMQFLDSVRPTHLPIWETPLSRTVSCVAFSPDGCWLAGCPGVFGDGNDFAIKLWDTASGKELSSLKGHTSYVTCVAFSPDGALLASGSGDNTIKIWKPASGLLFNSLKGHLDTVLSVAFDPSGFIIASGSLDHTIKVWDAVSGKEIKTFQANESYVNSVAFNPLGTLVASGSGDGAVTLWSSSGEELVSLKGHTGYVKSVAFSPDGTLLASGSADGTIIIWAVASGTFLTALHGHGTVVDCVAFSPDGSWLVSSSVDKSVKFWDIATRKEQSSIRGHTDFVESVAISPDGSRIATGSWDHSVKLWDNAPYRDFTSLQGHSNAATKVSNNSDSSIVAGGSSDNDIMLWDEVTGKELTILLGHQGLVNSYAFSPDGSRLASGSWDTTVKLWDSSSGKELKTLQGHTAAVNSVAFSPDGSCIASGSGDKSIKLWDISSGKPIVSFLGHSSPIWCVAFSPDGRRIASGSANTEIKIWEVSSGKELVALQSHLGPVESIGFSPDGARLACGSSDNAIDIWNTTSGKEITDVTPNEFAVAKGWLATNDHVLSRDKRHMVKRDKFDVFIVPYPLPTLDLTAPLRSGLLTLPGRELQFPGIKQTTPMMHVRQDTLAQLADPKLTPERRAELRMELCTKSSQFRAATALWQRLLQGEWPGFEGATVPKDQAPATIPADSPIRRLYLLALIDATKHPQIHGHPTICHTAAQIAPVLTKEMMATPTISLAMMSLMQTLAKDASPDMSAPRAALLKRLEEVATKDWLAVLRESTAK